jgi:hypothetical protein
MKKKDLKGRSFNSLETRLKYPFKMNWVTAHQEKKSHLRAELTLKKTIGKRMK